MENTFHAIMNNSFETAQVPENWKKTKNTLNLVIKN